MWYITSYMMQKERGTSRTLLIPHTSRGTMLARLHGSSQRTVSFKLPNNSLQLPVLVPLRLQARQGLSVLPLMTAAAAHMPTREPAHLVIHPVAPTDDDREEPSGGPQGRCPPSAWRPAACWSGRGGEWATPGPKSTSARPVARGLARWGRCLISPETAQELKTTANDSSRSNEHQTAQCPGLELQG